MTIPEIIPAVIATREGWLPRDGIMLPPKSRAVFDVTHPHPVYTSAMVASFAAVELNPLWLIEARVILVVDGGTTIAEALGRTLPLATYAGYVEIVQRIYDAPSWTPRQRATAAAACMMERLQRIPELAEGAIVASLKTFVRDDKVDGVFKTLDTWESPLRIYPRLQELFKSLEKEDRDTSDNAIRLVEDTALHLPPEEIERILTEVHSGDYRRLLDAKHRLGDV